MKNKLNTAIAVGAALSVVVFLLFGNTIMSFFRANSSLNSANATNSQNMNDTSGVQKQDVVVGNGPVAEPGDKVTVHYVGTLTDGKVFDSSKDRGAPFVFNLGTGEVIRGWDEGVAGMKVGGTRRLVIAPDYGYGDRAVGPIPPSSTLIFVVELLAVEKQ